MTLTIINKVEKYYIREKFAMVFDLMAIIWLKWLIFNDWLIIEFKNQLSLALFYILKLGSVIIKKHFIVSTHEWPFSAVSSSRRHKIHHTIALPLWKRFKHSNTHVKHIKCVWMFSFIYSEQRNRKDLWIYRILATTYRLCLTLCSAILLASLGITYS